MNKLLRLAAATAMAFSLTTGVAAAQVNVETPGPESRATVDVRHNRDTNVRNRTSASIENNNPQYVRSGDADAHRNTDAGSVESGMAKADSLMSVHASVNNTSSSEAALDCACESGGNGGNVTVRTPGPDSRANVDIRNNSNVEVSNVTDLTITNNNRQDVRSGNASASRNTNAGHVMTGDAEAISTFDLMLEVTN